MSISSTVKNIMPYLKTASGYVLHRLSSQAVEMDDGTTLEAKVTSLNNLISKKLNSANVVNNLTTTNSGYALDARQGKALNDSITSLNSALFKIFSYAYYRIPLIAAKSYRDIGYSDILSALQITADELISIEASLFDASVSSWDINIKNQPTDNRVRIQNNNDAAQDVYINLLIFYW